MITDVAGSLLPVGDDALAELDVQLGFDDDLIGGSPACPTASPACRRHPPALERAIGPPRLC